MEKNKNNDQRSNDNNQNDGYTMQEGKIMNRKNGKLSPMEKDVTLENGTVISKNGTYAKKGGKDTKFKEGEHIDLEGKMNTRDKQ